MKNIASFAAIGSTLTVGALCTGAARAAVVINVYPVGSDVVAVGSGTVNTSGLTLTNSNVQPNRGVNPSTGYLVIGSSRADFYRGFSGPASFGPGTITTSLSSATGTSMGIAVGFDTFVVPAGYLSGAPLNGSVTFNNQTISSLGLTEGSYVYTWGSGSNADTLTINVSSIPTPGAAALLGLGGVMAARRRRM